MSEEFRFRFGPEARASPLKRAAESYLETNVSTSNAGAVGGTNGAHVPMDAVNAGNVEFIEQQYEAYKRDRSSVDPQWAYFFAGFELANVQSMPAAAPVAAPSAGGLTPESAELQKAPGKFMQIGDLVHSYREMGHLVAELDPLGHNMTHHPLLELSEFNVDESDMGRTVTAEGFRGGLPGMVGKALCQHAGDGVRLPGQLGRQVAKPAGRRGAR